MRPALGVALAACLSALLLVSGAQARGAQTVTIQLTSLITQRADHDLPPKGKLNKGDFVGFKGATGTVVIGSGETRSPNTYIVTVPHALDISGARIA